MTTSLIYSKAEIGKAESRKQFRAKQKVESRKQKSQKAVSAISFGSIDHRGHDRHEFGRLLLQRDGKVSADPTFLTEKFEPEQGFVGFLECTAQLGNELVVRTAP
jgi:hypothetical protein